MTGDTISRELKYDVLIIGGGGAAGRAAIASASAGAKTLVVLKKKLGASGATTHKCCEIAGFNVPGCGDTNDTRETYLKDILDAALNMAKPELAGLLADNAKDRFEELCAWGVHPAEDNGKPIVMKGCYSNYRRGYTIKGHGEPIMHALIAQMQKLGVDIMEESMAVDLLMSGNRCCGALVLDENDRLVLVRAKATILATGGASRVFLNNLNPGDVSGDGYSLAYDNGAELMNMEFMQAGIGFFYPAKSLFNTYLWAGFPKLMNRSGEAFLQKYLPEGISEKDVMLMHCRHFPFSSKDISKYLEIGIQKELEAGGGTERMCVPVSFRHFTDEYIASLEYDADLKQLWPLVKSHFAQQGIDIVDDDIEITCVAQAINGGILIDSSAQSSVEGLFAAGETAAGPHGADRLGGNMMGTCQVFGEIAGRCAAEYAGKTDFVPCSYDLDGSLMLAVLHKNVPVEELTLELQKNAQTKLFICRTEEKLLDMLDKIAELKKRLIGAKDTDKLCRGNLELYHKLNAAYVMTIAAEQRKESRGSHYREDYPEIKEEFSSPIVIKRTGIKL